LEQPERITGADGKDRPASRPPRKRAETPPPAPEPDITPDVLRALAHYGANGATAWQAAFLIDSASPDEPHVNVVLNRLADDGQVQIVDATVGGALWALTELVDDATPEPDDERTCAHRGDGEDCECNGNDQPPEPAGEYRTDPAERIAAVAEVAPEYVKPAPAAEPEEQAKPHLSAAADRPATKEEKERARLLGDARRRAQRLVAEVASAINDIELGIASGGWDLVTAEMVAGLRAQADRLEQYVKEKKA
jgi:hypothetical protein